MERRADIFVIIVEFENQFQPYRITVKRIDMLYNVFSDTGAVALDVSFEEAKAIVRRYYDTYNQKDDFRAEFSDGEVWLSWCGHAPYCVCWMERSDLV